MCHDLIKQRDSGVMCSHAWLGLGLADRVPDRLVMSALCFGHAA